MAYFLTHEGLITEFSTHSGALHARIEVGVGSVHVVESKDLADILRTSPKYEDLRHE